MRWTGASQNRTGLAIAAVDRHPFPEGGDLLGKAVSGLLAKALYPLLEDLARGPVEPLGRSSSRVVESLNGDSFARCRISSE